MNKKQKTIEQIILHYAKTAKYQSFLDLTLIEKMLKRNGHDSKLADDICDEAFKLKYLI
jgi:hypothetical protein